LRIREDIPSIIRFDKKSTTILHVSRDIAMADDVDQTIHDLLAFIGVVFDDAQVVCLAVHLHQNLKPAVANVILVVFQREVATHLVGHDIIVGGLRGSVGGCGR